MDFRFFAQGLAVGFSIAAPVGPIGILCIRRSLAEGFAAGLACGLGAATADAAYGCVAAFGLASAANLLRDQQAYLNLVGGLFLCYLGLRAFLARPAENPAPGDKASLAGAYGSTFFLTLTNPATILSFAAIFSGLGLARAGGYASAALLVAGVFCGSASWWLLLSGGIGALNEKFNLRALQWINYLSGAVLIGCGWLALRR